MRCVRCRDEESPKNWKYSNQLAGPPPKLSIFGSPVLEFGKCWQDGKGVEPTNEILAAERDLYIRGAVSTMHSSYQIPGCSACHLKLSLLDRLPPSPLAALEARPVRPPNRRGTS